MHGGPAQFFGGVLLANRRLHQGRASQEKPAPFGHQDVVGHDRKIGSASHAHAHDGGDLGDALGTHHRVIAENSPKIVLVGEYILLQRKKNARRINQIDGGDAILHGDCLGPDDLFCRHGEERAGFNSGIVGNHHHQPSGNPPQASHHPGSGCATPLLIHAVGGEQAQLQEFLIRIEE
jgi:hypothetical protein